MEIEDVLIQGKWLKEAMRWQGISANQAADKLEIWPGKLYSHFNNKTYLNSASLAKLSRAYPKINLHYVLTGSGEPLL